jgi:cell division transport system permease protein
MKKPVRKPYVPAKPVKHDTPQTLVAGGTYIDKIQAYCDIHAHALFSSLGKLVATPFSSIMTVAVLAISISMAAGFYILLGNVQQLTASIETSNQISLFLRDDVSASHANNLAESIRQNSDVQAVKLISKEEALAEFKAYSGFGSAINALGKNPLPIVIEVLPKNSLENKKNIENMLKSFRQSPEVDFAELDMQWVERLQSMIDLAQRSAILLSFMLGIAVLFITGNTIRLELNNRQDEVMIAKLVGATNAFIQRPFLYCGFWLGFMSGVLAWFIVTVLMLILRQSVEKVSELYQGVFHIMFLGITETFALLLISSALGVLGSWAVLFYQLRHTNPR